MLNTLQAGRGLAALAVLMFHLSLIVEHMTGVSPFWSVTQFGNRGVDFFFVLSGFIIMRAHRTDIGCPTRWINFIRKRFIRIFPIYWLYTALVVGALSIGLGSFPLPETAAGWFATTISLLRFADVVTPLPQAWTLFHEMLFYAAFSLLIVSRFYGRIVLIIWFSASALIFHYMPAQTDPGFVLLNSYNLNFALGIGACFAARKLKDIELPSSIFGLALIAVAMILSGFAQDLLFGLGFAVLVATGASLESSRVVSIPFAALLGNASYSIYLTHEITQVIGERVTTALGIVNPYVLFTLIGTGSLFAGIAAYLLIEKPLLDVVRSNSLGGLGLLRSGDRS